MKKAGAEWAPAYRKYRLFPAKPSSAQMHGSVAVWTRYDPAMATTGTIEKRPFEIRATARFALLAVLFGAVLTRAADMIAALKAGDEALLLAFPLAVIFPAALVLLLAVMPPAKSREGLLMRIGTMIQLLLIIMLPAVSLYLTLGLPVVFLVVELFETRLPAAIRLPLTRLFVA